jgi:iron complex outermembrane receptor protein
MVGFNAEGIMAGRLSRGVSTAAIMAALSAQPAIAQQEAQDRVPEPQSGPEANSANGAAVPVASPEEESGLGEIVVTAQRVAESSQRAPIALDVISPEELVRQNVIRAEDLSRTSNALSATEEPRTYGVRIGGKF